MVYIRENYNINIINQNIYYQPFVAGFAGVGYSAGIGGIYSPFIGGLGGFGGIGAFGYGAYGVAGLAYGYTLTNQISYTNFGYYRELRSQDVYKDYKMQDVWLKETVNRWWRRSDPVMIDLDGNGKIDLQDKRGVFRWRTGNWWRGESHSINQWVKPKGDKTDGVLVTLDQRQIESYLKGNTVSVDYRKNLFGEYDKNGVKRYRNGYEKLRAYYDKNHDGVIDQNEIRRAKDLYVWQDKDGDGKIDQGELFRPEKLGITKFDTNKNSYTRKVGTKYYYEEGLRDGFRDVPLRRIETFQFDPSALRTLGYGELNRLLAQNPTVGFDYRYLLLLLLYGGFGSYALGGRYAIA